MESIMESTVMEVSGRKGRGSNLFIFFVLFFLIHSFFEKLNKLSVYAFQGSNLQMFLLVTMVTSCVTLEETIGSNL